MSEQPTETPLALVGGEPTFPQGPPAWPRPLAAVQEALQQVFASGDWGRYHGPHTEALCERLAAMHRQQHVRLCSSGTIAVELALRGLQIGNGDEVLLAAYDFPGNFRAIEAVGAVPVLVDICPHTWCLDAELLPAAISSRTRAVLVSHLHGGLADMPRIVSLARQRGLAVIEDACQAPGAVIAGRPAGAYGDVAVLSFGGSKLLTAGRGGAIMTGDQRTAQRIRIFAERGNDAFAMSQLQAAVLVPQLQALEDDHARRRIAAQEWITAVNRTAQLMPVAWPTDGWQAGYYKIAMLLDDRAGDRSWWIAACQAEGLAIDAGFRGFAQRSSRRCRQAGSLEHAQGAAERTLLLHHPLLLEPLEVVQRASEALQKVARSAPV